MTSNDIMSLLSRTIEFSVVIPVYNEEGNLAPLVKEISDSCKSYAYEVLIVDDGSTDTTLKEAQDLAISDRRVRVVKLKRNFGQTAALAAGIDEAKGAVIIPLDGDGQNDPKEIPRLYAEMKNGFDVVSGWRKSRKDAFLSRKLPSWTANRLISMITGVSLHDYGCTLKAYRTSLIKDLQISGEMHRFLPAWCAWKGGKVTEIPVNHRARQRGQSKYGIFRIFKVLIDLMTLKFFSGYLFKPNHLFTGSAFFLFGLSLLSSGLAFYDKFGPNQYAEYRIPLLLLSVGFVIVSIFMVLLGFVAELLVRLYYSVEKQKPYIIDHDQKA